uniref:Tetratricopeptide repeat domain 22 n=1 Tax=Fundulus heteroclitus TaxID=8078 RepID=A0A3Q2SNT1_FUNHE
METDNTEDIESLIEDMQYIPGHFHLELSLNCDPVGPVNLRFRDTLLKQESLQAELEVEVGHLQYAVRNLLGLLAFHLDQPDKAEEIFRYKTLTSSVKVRQREIILIMLSVWILVILAASNRNTTLAWCYVGIMLERKDEFSSVPMSIHDCGFSASDPLSCFGTVTFILNLLAKIIFLLGKHDMATGICNMALNILPDPELNWEAYCMRAKINVVVYVNQLEKAKHGMGGVPERQKLADARKDLDKVLTVRPCLRTHLEMAQIYYYMGVDALQETIMVDESSINHALVSLSKALQFKPADSLPDLHVLRGRCLLIKGEEQNAAECFKQAMELERPGSTDTTTLHCLLLTLLNLFILEASDPSSAITQLETWVNKAEERYPQERVKSELRSLYRTHTEEVTELSKTLIRTGRLGLVKRLLETVAPQQLAERRPLARAFSLS